jgi:hypothetical protein
LVRCLTKSMKERPQKRGFSNNFPPNRSRKSTRSWGPAFGEPLWPQDEKRNRSFRRPFTNDLPKRDAQPDIPWEELVKGDRDDIAAGHRYLCDPVARAQHEAFIFGKPLTEVEGEGEPEQQEALQRQADSSEVEEGLSEETSIQAKCDCEKKQEEAVNLKADSPAPTTSEQDSEEISLKADTSPVEDPSKEADAKAAEVMKMEDPAASPEVEEESSDNAIQKQPLAQTITPLVQRQGNQEKGNRANVEQQLGQGGGQPLGQETRSFMESRFGADFSGVRVHTDSAAVQMNKDLGAQAFTHGQNIYFGKGKSPEKNELTAHELTHTIQQKVKSEQVARAKTEVIQRFAPAMTPAVVFGPVGLTIVGLTIVVLFLNSGGWEEIGRIGNFIVRGISGTLEDLEDILSRAGEAARARLGQIGDYIREHIFPMAAPGNQADSGIMEEVHTLIRSGKAGDICEALAILMKEAKAAKDTKRQQRIKKTQKANNCRHSRHS